MNSSLHPSLTDASRAEIKKAYRKLSIELHPDRAGGAESSRFLDVKRAYEILSDDIARESFLVGRFHTRGGWGGELPGAVQRAHMGKEEWQLELGIITPALLSLAAPCR